MTKALVGHTGFVGSNISGQAGFDFVFNSKNIEKAYGLQPDLLVYSGVPAEKFYANQNPEKDFQIIQQAIENIQKINPKKLVLVSTVDVYPHPVKVDEQSVINESDLQPYGKNRLFLEKWVEEHFEDYVIIRLPGLFGNNLKKNFIFDLINVVPSALNQDKYEELQKNNLWLKDYYSLQDDNFYRLKPIAETEKAELKQKFLQTGFSAINFTDSRGVFQFYNLDNIWKDISAALAHKIKKINFATEPLAVSEIYQAVFNKPFMNEVATQVPYYDFETKFAEYYNGKSPYLYSKEAILSDIEKFIQAER